MFSRIIQKLKSILVPKKPLQEPAKEIELRFLYEDWLKRRLHRKRKTCKRGHLICLENAHVADMRRSRRYTCLICLKQYRAVEHRKRRKITQAKIVDTINIHTSTTPLPPDKSINRASGALTQTCLTNLGCHVPIGPVPRCATAQPARL